MPHVTFALETAQIQLDDALQAAKRERLPNAEVRAIERVCAMARGALRRLKRKKPK